MHQDSAGILLGNDSYCGVKKYTVGATWPWLSVKTPADPATQPFELQVTTTSYALANTYTVSIVVGFVTAGYPTTITQTVSITLIHPCVVTTIIPSPALVTMDYMCGRPAMTQVFTAFTDSVSTSYGVANLCNL